MSIRIYGWQTTHDECDVGRVYAKARYGQAEVLIPLDAVEVFTTDSPLEVQLASADASRRLAVELIKYADGIERKQTEGTVLPVDNTPQARWLREHPDAIRFRDWWLTMQPVLKGMSAESQSKANQAFQHALAEAMALSK